MNEKIQIKNIKLLDINNDTSLNELENLGKLLIIQM